MIGFEKKLNKAKTIIILSVAIALFLAGCHKSSDIPAEPSTEAHINDNMIQNQKIDQNVMLNKIYETPGSDYTIYTSDLLDIFFIATGLKLEFESNNLLPNSDYVGAMYQNMDWNRVIDENIVRAVEARIYAKEYGDDTKAFKQVLEKEIKLGGFTKVDKLFDALKTYENDSVNYGSIDMYIPRLVRVMFESIG